MSSALAKASPLKPEIRLAQAVSEFEASLSNEQKSTFQTLRSQSLSTTPGPHDVMQLTAEVDHRTSTKFGSACFGPRFTNFLHGVQQFAALGDIMVGGSQNLLACGVWSLVRMSLLSIVNLSTYIDKLSSLFMDVGRSAPLYNDIALLYPQSSRLQSHLSEYFIVVVGLCHYLFKFGQKSTIQQFASSLSDARLKTFQADLNKWGTSIKEQMGVNEAQKSSGFRALTREMFNSTAYQQRLTAKMRVLNFCSTYDHEVAWKQIRKAGNTSIYRQQAEYQEWRDDSHSSTLLYTGKLGSGKSVLLANIVDDLSLFSAKKDSALVAYFFCKHDIPESLQARTIIGSLARQLLRTVPDLSALAKNCENTHTIGNTERVLETLFQGFSADAKVYFVLDGLDECDDEENETVVQAIRKIQVKLKMLVCASFREEPNNSRLQSITSQLLAPRDVSIPDDNPDIDAFIEADLERCLRQKRLTIGDPTLILEIQDALSKGSQGMFLWVALQIQTLCSIKTDHAMREALADLPKDLSETFARILQKSGSSDPALQRKTLQFVLAAYRPFTTNELREALSVTPGDTTWDSSKILNDVYSALACCGCLLAVDEEELTVRFVHHSVKKYILNESDGDTNFSFKEAQRMLADTVVTYFSYNVFGTELSRLKVRRIVAQSAPSKIVQATVSSSSTARHLAIQLLGSRRKHDFDMSKVLAEAHNSSNSKPEHAFTFYTYAKAYWQDHVFYVSGHNPAILKLCSKLINSHKVKLNRVGKDYWARFQWAAENGNRNVLELLLQARKADVEAEDSDGWRPLMQAARYGHRDAIEVLLSVGKANVEAKTSYGTTALMIATAYGRRDAVEVLLSVGKADVEGKSMFEATALMMAAGAGHRDVVEVLLSVGKADVEAKDESSSTALMMAIGGGHKDTVEVLLRVGKADVGAKALALAVKHGHRDIAELLRLYTNPMSRA